MYKITIKKLESKQVVETDWVKLRDSYPNEDQKVAIGDIDKEKDPQYGYRKTEMEKVFETEVLDQTVDDMDITKVIKAVNNIE